MARIVTPLTVLKIDASDPKNKEYALFDGDGLMLVIKPDGTKTWIYRFKSPEDGKDKKITIGKYLAKNKGVSLKEARDECDRLKTQLKEGIVPIGKKKAKIIEKIKIDVESDKQITKIVDDFFAYQSTVLKRDKVHLQKQKRRMEMYVLPFVAVNIDEISKQEIT